MNSHLKCEFTLVCSRIAFLFCDLGKRLRRIHSFPRTLSHTLVHTFCRLFFTSCFHSSSRTLWAHSSAALVCALLRMVCLVRCDCACLLIAQLPRMLLLLRVCRSRASHATDTRAVFCSACQSHSAACVLLRSQHARNVNPKQVRQL